MQQATDQFLLDILRQQMRPAHNMVFASGDMGNNHIDLSYDETAPMLRQRISERLVTVISYEFPHIDFLAPVPSGAVGWVSHVTRPDGGLSTIESISISKVAKREFIATSNERKRIKKHFLGSQGVVVDDVTRDGGTAEAYATSLESLGVTIVGVLSILHRSKEYAKSNYRRTAVLEAEIPDYIDWKIWQDTGILVPFQSQSNARVVEW